MNKRARVTRVTMGIRYPGGMTEMRHIDGQEAEAILNSDRGVTEILAPFYKTTERRLSRADLIDVCGPRATSLIGNQEEIQITPTLVADLWNLEDEEGLLPPVIMKIPDCILEIPRLQATVKSISRRKAA
jgi:hypothetical protein